MGKAKFWLIYTDYKGRKTKPFVSLEGIENYIEQNKEYITVIAKTRSIE